jgi:hypothetical protein
MVATYQVGAPVGPYTNIVAKIVELRWTNWTPQAFSEVGGSAHQRSLISVEYEAATAAFDASASNSAASARRIDFSYNPLCWQRRPSPGAVVGLEHPRAVGYAHGEPRSITPSCAVPY